MMFPFRGLASALVWNKPVFTEGNGAPMCASPFLGAWTKPAEVRVLMTKQFRQGEPVPWRFKPGTTATITWIEVVSLRRCAHQRFSLWHDCTRSWFRCSRTMQLFTVVCCAILASRTFLVAAIFPAMMGEFVVTAAAAVLPSPPNLSGGFPLSREFAFCGCHRRNSCRRNNGTYFALALLLESGIRCGEWWAFCNTAGR